MKTREVRTVSSKTYQKLSKRLQEELYRKNDQKCGGGYRVMRKHLSNKH